MRKKYNCVSHSPDTKTKAQQTINAVLFFILEQSMSGRSTRLLGCDVLGQLMIRVLRD